MTIASQKMIELLDQYCRNGTKGYQQCYEEVVAHVDAWAASYKERAEKAEARVAQLTETVNLSIDLQNQAHSDCEKAEAELAAAFATHDGMTCKEVSEQVGGIIDFLTEARLQAEAERDHWKANHADMVKRAALLSQRDDLPVDRLPAYRELEALQKLVGAKQAEIDRLMLEFCPDEMTAEQIAECEKHQRVVHHPAFGKTPEQILEIRKRLAAAWIAKDLPEPEVLGFDREDNDITGYTSDQMRVIVKHHGQMAIMLKRCMIEISSLLRTGQRDEDNHVLHDAQTLLDAYACMALRQSGVAFNERAAMKCHVNEFSSRVCERGVKGCNISHGNNPYVSAFDQGRATAPVSQPAAHEVTVRVPQGGRAFRVPPDVAHELARLRKPIELTNDHIRAAGGIVHKDFHIPDDDLDALLNAVASWGRGDPQNMDSGLYLMDLIEKVSQRLASNALPQPVAEWVNDEQGFQRLTELPIPDGTQLYANAEPQGWKLVPIEPTEAMMHAAEDIAPPRRFGAVYRAMLAAAPKETK